MRDEEPRPMATVGLLEGDRTSFPSQDPNWRPVPPTIGGKPAGQDFRMVDPLRLMGVA